MKLKLISDLDINECIDILNKNLKSRMDCDEFCGKVTANRFWIIRYCLDNAGMRYGPPILKGSLTPVTNGTLIEGNFSNRLIVYVIERIGCTVLGIFTTLLFILSLIDLVLGTGFGVKDAPPTVVVLIFGLIMSAFFFGFPSYCRRLRANDREQIKNFLIEKLSSKIDIESE